MFSSQVLSAIPQRSEKAPTADLMCIRTLSFLEIMQSEMLCVGNQGLHRILKRFSIVKTEKKNVLETN